jgi:hypothetical protein
MGGFGWNLRRPGREDGAGTFHHIPIKPHVWFPGNLGIRAIPFRGLPPSCRVKDPNIYFVVPSVFSVLGCACLTKF